MDDLSSKINEILSDPQALQQIKGLGEMLGIADTSQSVQQKSKNNGDNMLSAFTGGLSPDMLSLLSKVAPLMSNLNKEDDTTRLLLALRPFLSDERKKKLDEASKILKIMKLLPLIKETKIFDSLF